LRLEEYYFLTLGYFETFEKVPNNIEFWVRQVYWVSRESRKKDRNKKSLHLQKSKICDQVKVQAVKFFVIIPYVD